MDAQGNFAIHRLEGKDTLGDRNYFETPGGGMEDGELIEEALIRECLEEVGYKIEIIEEVALIHDYYNVIGWHNHSHYFLCKINSPFLGKHFVSDGDSLIAETIFLPIDEVINRYENQSNVMLSRIVKDRELPVWRHLRDLLNK